MFCICNCALSRLYVVFKSKARKIEDAKIKPRKGHSNTKSLEIVIIQQSKNNKPNINNISRNISSKLHTIYLSYNHQTSRKFNVLKSQYAMHQRGQLKSKYQAQQKENKEKVSKMSQENESLLNVPDERSYKVRILSRSKM